MIFGDIEIGKNYEASDVNLLIKKLYETTFFSNISVEITKWSINKYCCKRKSDYKFNNF